jgi:sn1-specific diacylglycerol lipase
MLTTANKILEKIKSHNILEKAFEKYPTYNLLITGHSLGANVACLLSIKLRKDYPNLRCIAYSPSSGLLSKEAVNFTRKFTLSVVLGDDVISRLSIRSIHSFTMDISEVFFLFNLLFTKKLEQLYLGNI